MCVMTVDYELCELQSAIGEQIKNEASKNFLVFGLWELEKDDSCKIVIDYTIKDVESRLKEGSWRPLQASSIGFQCEDRKCEIETDLVVPYETDNRYIWLFRTVDNCEVIGVHEKLDYEKHIHVKCRVNVGDVKDTVSDILKLYKRILDQHRI